MPFSVSDRDNAYLLALYLSIFLVGWDDGSAGPLIPRMQESYGVGYTVVSIIFICKCAGAFTAALAATSGAIIQIIAFTIQAPRPPFPVLAIAYYIDGFGGALQDAQANALLTMFPTNQHAKMMVGHGMYGLGALISPLISTQFAQKQRWAFMYLTSLGLAVITIVVLLAVFRLRSQASILEDLAARKAGGHPDGETPPKVEEQIQYQGWDKYYALMRMPAVHLAALFIFTYVGAEVCVGAWSVTYLLRERGGGASSGYVSSGFFGGLTLGRFALIGVSQLLGERRVIFYYIAICIGLQLSVWLANSLIGNAVAISFVGFFLGPIYPQLVLLLAHFVPPRDADECNSFMGGAVGWITCLGATGAAVFPFIAGAMASKFGVWVMQPLIVALMGAMIVLWALTLLTQLKPQSTAHPGTAEAAQGHMAIEKKDEEAGSPCPTA
ncbi:MFS general substrate transporter [Clavulina sp. PMI_390]|nr:MFS general substrate transporter [Clavulina sp. PMI_390]